MSKWLIAPLLWLAAACQTPQLEVVVPLAIVNVAPGDGATGVDPATVPTICFNRDMSPVTAGDLLALESDAGEAVAGQRATATAEPRCLEIVHPNLAAGASYVIRARRDLPAADGTLLAAEVVSRFRTADAVP